MATKKAPKFKKQKVKIKDEGITATLSIAPLQGVTWMEALELQLSALRGHYPYLTMQMVIEHLQEEYSHLLESDTAGTPTEENEDE